MTNNEAEKAYIYLKRRLSLLKTIEQIQEEYRNDHDYNAAYYAMKKITLEFDSFNANEVKYNEN